ALDVGRCVTNLFNRAGLDTIQHTGQHRARRLPNNSKYGYRDKQPDNWVRQRIPKPNTGRTGNHGEAGQTVRSCMISIGDQSGTVDLPPNLNTEHCHGLVANETDDAREGDPEKPGDGLWMDK